MTKHIKKIIFLLPIIALMFFINNVYAQSPGEAIAIRVMPNTERLSPTMWYQANVPNPGQPTSLEIDGYPAIRDGRSVYVAATNYVPGNLGALYSNIYLISHSQTANAKVQAVFEEFLKQLRFNTNINDEEVRLQIRRDMRRANDLNLIKSLLNKYRAQTGSYAKFEAGSYLPDTSYSTWPSWQSTFGNLLGSGLPVDPRNKFYGCTDPYDEITCWDEENVKFACPPEAYVYGYRASQDGSSYSLFSNYEYSGPGTWKTQEFDQQTSDQCFNFVTADIIDVDGDGIPNGQDNCANMNNPNQTDMDNDGIGDVCDSCPSDPRNDEDNDGICSNDDICPTLGNPAQVDIDGDGVGDECDHQTCGNNLTEGTEVCDGQSGIKANQTCSPDCRTINQLTYCGDNIVQTPNDQQIVEDCDGNNEEQLCEELIDGYRSQRTRRCRETCRFTPYTDCAPIEYCGDSIVNGYEHCDVGDQNAVQCVAGYGETCQYCAFNCKHEIAEGPKCGDGVIQEENGEQCDSGVNNGRVCTPPYGKTCDYCSTSCQNIVVPAPFCGDGNKDIPFEECDTQIQDIACEPQPTYMYKKRECVMEANPDYSLCSWGPFAACRAIGRCGDGVINGPEQCDDAKTPGICSGCKRANNVVKATYSITGKSVISVCLAPKIDWTPLVGGWRADVGNSGPMTDQEVEMTCAGSYSEPYLDQDGQPFLTIWGGIRNATVNDLGFPMLVNQVVWDFYNCGGHFIELRDGETVQDVAKFWTPKQGDHCVNDWTFHIGKFNGMYADKILADETDHGGGFVRGIVHIKNSMDINSQNGVVVLEQLSDRRDNRGDPVPWDEYTLAYQNNGALVWFGKTATTSYSQGSETVLTPNTYVLGCVDVDNNKVCDFTQSF